MGAFEEGFEVTLRSVVKSGESITHLVGSLTGLYGQGSEVDIFRERLVFRPREEVGNMNFVNRDCSIDIEYTKDEIRVKHLVSTATAGKAAVPQTCEIFCVRLSSCSNCTFRRMFLKAGFTVVSDFGQKGLRFKAPNEVVITITRPHNAEINPNASYQSGKLVWENISGQPPFGQDYLLEVSSITREQSDVEDLLASLAEISCHIVQ
jgi:hypothetical protein